MAATTTRTYFSSSESDTMSLGAAIGGALLIGDVVILIGDLGAGKTRLAKGIVSAACQVDPDDVVSPSFSLINRYEGEMIVDHADLYRLTTDQLGHLGIYEALDEGALVVEWGTGKEEFEDNELQIVIAYSQDEERRKIELSHATAGSWHERIVKVLDTLRTTGATMDQQMHSIQD